MGWALVGAVVWFVLRRLLFGRWVLFLWALCITPLPSFGQVFGDPSAHVYLVPGGAGGQVYQRIRWELREDGFGGGSTMVQVYGGAFRVHLVATNGFVPLTGFGSYYVGSSFGVVEVNDDGESSDISGEYTFLLEDGGSAGLKLTISGPGLSVSSYGKGAAYSSFGNTAAVVFRNPAVWDAFENDPAIGNGATQYYAWPLPEGQDVVDRWDTQVSVVGVNSPYSGATTQPTTQPVTTEMQSKGILGWLRKDAEEGVFSDFGMMYESLSPFGDGGHADSVIRFGEGGEGNVGNFEEFPREVNFALVLPDRDPDPGDVFDALSSAMTSSMGFTAGSSGGSLLPEEIRSVRQAVLFVVDGLDDWWQTAPFQAVVGFTKTWIRPFTTVYILYHFVLWSLSRFAWALSMRDPDQFGEAISGG